MPALQSSSLAFDGGLNTRETAFTISDAELAGQSIWNNRRNRALTNEAAVKSFAVGAGTNQLTYLHEVLIGSGSVTRYLLGYYAQNQTWYQTNNIDTTGFSTIFQWTTVNTNSQVAVMNATAWFVNGADSCQQWDGTTASTVAAMPKARHIQIYKNYCFVAGTTANPSRVFFSSLKDPTTWPTNNFQDVSPNDGDDITALYSTAESLMIFKQRSAWMMIGDTFDATNPQWRLVKLESTEGSGTASNRSIQYFPGVGVVWLGRDGFYVWDGAHIKMLGDQIRDTVAALNPYGVGYDGTLKNRREAQAALFRNELHFVIEDAAAITQRSWITMDISGKWRRLANSGSVLFALVNYNNRLFYGANTNLVWEYAGTASTELLAASATTKLMDGTQPDLWKHYRRLWVLYEITSGPTGLSGAFDIVITAIPDGSATTFTSTLTATSGTNITGNFYEQVLEINLVARRLQFTFATTDRTYTAYTGTVRTAIHDLRLEYSTQSDRGATK